MRRFEDLRVWQEAFALTKECYALTDELPSTERFGLSSQLRRSAVSVASNLAEGCGRITDADVRRFVVMAAGSASEVQCQLLLVRELYGPNRPVLRDALDRVTIVKRMLYGLERSLSTDRASG